jgi:hypothetical protein
VRHNQQVARNTIAAHSRHCFLCTTRYMYPQNTKPIKTNILQRKLLESKSIINLSKQGQQTHSLPLQRLWTTLTSKQSTIVNVRDCKLAADQIKFEHPRPAHHEFWSFTTNRQTSRLLHGTKFVPRGGSMRPSLLTIGCPGQLQYTDINHQAAGSLERVFYTF